jgi:hypothetical protein
MAKYAVLDNNKKVENIIEVEPEVAAKEFPNAIFYTNEVSVGIGWSYDGEKFVAPTTESNTDPVE